MSSSVHALLEAYRDAARTEREKGTYFERFVLAYLKHDPMQKQQFSDAWTYADWAEMQGIDKTDAGIDLVAKVRDQDGFCAIQCKFYREGYRVQKGDIDSFFTASGKTGFIRRLIVDTTDTPWSKNAEEALDGQAIPTNRIGLTDLSESPIDWNAFERDNEIKLVRKKLRRHQQDALEAVDAGLKKADRGKLIMACGTGKTFTSLKIAEHMAGKGKRVLYLVPSLALMSQTVREWTADADPAIPLRSFAACSDTKVGKRSKSDDYADIEVHDLAFPATTKADRLAEKAGPDAPDEMTVVFSTYQSLPVITRAQQEHGLPDFDLIVCDEAHRTTGAKIDGEDESNFIRVHDQAHIRGHKRLYMTATPRIYGDNVKSRASEASVELCSMDDESLFGETLFARGFSWAVEQGLLTDYKVIVLAVDESIVSRAVQWRLQDADSEIALDDATKIIGCYKALTKADLQEDLAGDGQHMRRALAFCRDIKSSKLVKNEFAKVVDEYLDNVDDDEAERVKLGCEIDHVDGTFNAKDRGRLLEWLKADAGDETCRILSNARCLSEGVDVPALDAILFLHPRKSQIDVVQSVGRVMRKAEGKRMGYVILPVGIPAGKAPEEALNDNEKYRVVWQILNALRAHDERVDGQINQMSLGQDVSDRIEVIAVADQLPNKAAPAESAGIGAGASANDDDRHHDPLGGRGVREPEQMQFVYDEFTAAIRAKIVKKCGTRDYWEDWAANIAEIAQNHITRLKGILATPETKARIAFDEFVEELQDDLNNSITEDDAVEMLAQHIITRPVFETLFEGHKFTQENPVSRAMQRVLDVLDEANLDKESKDLENFYASVQRRAQGITDPNAKQKLVVELYDKFFRRAFPRTTEKLGIVYTPVEIVDFIIHSVNEVLQTEFGQTLGSKGVHIIDPFTGTGTFITRLLQSGLIKPEEMEHKFRHEIHANEIVLLAYYIAAINIEAVYHGITGDEDYVPFEGICLTDTFQMYEAEDMVARLMPDNSERRKRQKELDIRVVMGNPPYSSGQNSANDNAANVAYPYLDGRIRDTYAARSTATLKNSLYDSYIRAIRWASDRIGDAGVMAFVTNAGWVDGNAADGIRACLADEFSDVYVFHLRGNQRTSGEVARREGGKIFGAGSRAPIAISVFVKNPAAAERGRIWFHDIGDYLDQKQKLSIVQEFRSLSGIQNAGGWAQIEPDDHNDWLNQRDQSFDRFIKIGEKGASQQVLFGDYSGGVSTGRDAWVYNFDRQALSDQISGLVSIYNAEVDRFDNAFPGADLKEKSRLIDSFVEADPKKIKWTHGLRADVVRQRRHNFSTDCIRAAVYRPFTRTWLYFSRDFNERVLQMPRIFPMDYALADNLIISVPAPGNVTPFSTLMSDTLFDLSVTAAKAGTQCFPLYIFDRLVSHADNLFEGLPSSIQRRHAITDFGLNAFQAAYEDGSVSKEDIFYYVYGLLHSEEYRTRYADNLTKELPRIPCVKRAEDFWAFSKAGRALGELHVNYEAVEPYPVRYANGEEGLWQVDDPEAFYRVTKMKFAGKRPNLDKTRVVYNANITMEGIPLDAYDYVVNGKPALEWVMERQVVKTDKASGIVNDANRYAIETMNDPAYPLKLFQRVITVSLETMKIVRDLPKLDID